MNETKTAGQSLTIISSSVTLISLVLSFAFKLQIDLQEQGEIINLGMTCLGVLSTAIAIYGRVRATKVIAPKGN